MITNNLEQDVIVGCMAGDQEDDTRYHRLGSPGNYWSLSIDAR